MGATKVTRRGLLAGAAASGIGAATARGSLLSGLLTLDYDVVVVGAGGAGMSAALGALRANPNAKVAVLDAKPTHGGTTFRSGGWLWIPNNSDMRAAGIVDPKPDALAYMARLSHPDVYDPGAPRLGLAQRHYEQLAAYYDNASEIFDYYRQTKLLPWEAVRWVKFPWNADPLHLEGTFTPDYHPELPENVAAHGRSVTTKVFDPTGLTRGAQVPDLNYGASLAGIYLAEWLFYSCLTRGVDFHFATRALDLLVTQSAGRKIVSGVVGSTMLYDITTPIQTTFRARKGVVLASGGFSKNAATLSANFNGPNAFSGGGCAVTSAKGDVVDIAARYGFALENMHNAWNIENVYEQYKLDPDSLTQLNYLLFQAYWLNGDSMISVNRKAQRVVNEKLNYNDRTAVHFQSPDNKFLFNIFDQHTFDHYIVGVGGQVTPLINTIIGPACSTEQLRDLILQRAARYPDVRAFGLAADFAASLDATIARFNTFARGGVDEDFHRGETAIDIWWHAFSLYFENVETGNVTLLKDPISANVDENGVRYPNVTMRPMKPPYYAVILSSGLQDTKGGPAIDAGARVLDTNFNPVTGLYGAGNAIGSPAGAGYWGAGGTLGPAVVFGHIAGRNAALRA